MTLLSLASKQIWPQVLGFLQLTPRPCRVVLFHTDEESESAGPARRIKELFITQGLLASHAVELVRVPHDNFQSIIEIFGATSERLGLDESNCRVNFTGGNKLMALAAAEWCRLAGSPCFYLERDLRIFPFLCKNNDLVSQPLYQLDIHLARQIEPLDLLRCQIGSAEVVGPGQRLTLNSAGRSLTEDQIGPLLDQNIDFRKFLDWDVPEPKENFGFDLEFAAAVALLKLGVPVVQRSVRLAPKVLRGSGKKEGEIDLVFNWGGKLWVVDCKNRLSADSRINQLRVLIHRQIRSDDKLIDLLARMGDELKEKELHPLKDDLLAVAEVGGLLGQAICVRLSALPTGAAEFAQSRKVPVVLKNRLVSDLKPILFPNEPASITDLLSLATNQTHNRL